MRKVIQNILSINSFWVINKKLTIELGFEASLFLSDLISKHLYFESKGMTDIDGGFYNSREDIERDTGLSSYQQRNACNILIKGDLLKITRKDNPAKNYYYINYDKINRILSRE